MKWHRAEIEWGEVSIPQICPNCLAPGTEEVRVDHRNLVVDLFSPFSSASSHVFNFCADCAPRMRAIRDYLRVRGWLVWLLMLPFYPYTLPWLAFKRRKIRRNFPKKDTQITFGPAAYYLGWGKYKAAHRAWLDALIASNPPPAD